MLDIDMIKILVADDPRPWSRLTDLGSSQLFEIDVSDRAEADGLAVHLRDLGVVVEIREGLAKSADSPDFWVVVGHIADVAGIGVPLVEGFLKSEVGKRLRAVLTRADRKELHPAFSFDALVAWCNLHLGEPKADGSPSWRFDPESIKARPLGAGLVALEVHEQISGRVLLLASDGETVEWLSDRVQAGPKD